MPTKILTHFAHGVYQTELSKVPNTEYYHVVADEGGKFEPSKAPKGFWGKNEPLPRNISMIREKDVDSVDFDIILVHWHPFIDQFKQFWPELPMIFLEHTWPYKNMQSEVLHWKNIRQQYCDHTVFITPSSRDAWGATNSPQASYIYHSIDTENFPKKTNYTGKQVMTTTNEFISRDWACGFSLWANVLGVPIKPYFDNIALYGYGNDNIGKVAKGPRLREEILDLLCNAGLYFNPSIMSPVPMSLLEAVAVGTPIVSTSHCEAGTIFMNGEHGIISNDPVELREGIRRILEDSEIAKEMANNARQVVKDKFNPDRFRKEWSDLFERLKKK